MLRPRTCDRNEHGRSAHTHSSAIHAALTRSLIGEAPAAGRRARSPPSHRLGDRGCLGGLKVAPEELWDHPEYRSVVRSSAVVSGREPDRASLCRGPHDPGKYGVRWSVVGAARFERALGGVTIRLQGGPEMDVNRGRDAAGGSQLPIRARRLLQVLGPDLTCGYRRNQSGRRDSNPRPSAWQGAGPERCASFK